MIFQLRNKNNETVIDIETYIQNTDNDSRVVECKFSLNVKKYSEIIVYLSKRNATFLDDFINDVEDLSQIRGWLWEVYFRDIKNTSKWYSDASIHIMKKIQEFQEKWHILVYFVQC